MESNPEVPWRIRDVVFVFLLTLLFGSGAAVVVGAAVHSDLLSQRVATAVLLPLSPILLGGVCVAYAALRTAHPARLLLGRTERAGRELGLGVLLGLAATVGQVLVVQLAEALFRVSVDDVQVPLREAALDPGLRPVLFLGAVVLAPLAEELFFRGMAYRALARRIGRVGGVLLSAAFFGVAHLSLDAPPGASGVLFAVTFLLGVLLASLLERRQSLLAPIAVHATFNLVSLSALVLESAQ